MLNKIRNMNFGWILIMVGITVLLFGVALKESPSNSSLLCFDKGCVTVQGITNVVIGILSIIIGVVKLRR